MRFTCKRCKGEMAESITLSHGKFINALKCKGCGHTAKPWLVQITKNEKSPR